MGTRTGLNFPLNGEPGSDIRLVWSGANLLDRTAQTVIWKAKYSSNQVGYFAVTWNSPNTGSWDFGVYSYGAHPYPTTGTYNAVSGQDTGVTGASGTTHYHEIAGLGAYDFIATGDPGGVPQGNLQVVKDSWLAESRSVTITGGTNLRHTARPDLLGNSSFSIVQDYPLASIGSPASPAFYIGASDWTASGTTNSETPGGVIRGIVLFNTEISSTHILAIGALETDAEVLAYCSANSLTSNLWYLNMNPTPGDVTDKSGAGHNPSFANANLPGLYQEDTPFVRKRFPLKTPFLPNKKNRGFWELNPQNWGQTPLDTAKWFAPELTASTSSVPTGTLARTNANDTSSAAGTTTIVSTVARTNANDTSSAQGTTTILSTLARTNANDTLSSAATPVSPGSLARTNANDTLAASGNTWPNSTLATTNANDTLAASGSVGSSPDGSVAYTNINDTSSAAGNTGILSTLASTNANDTLAAAGSPIGGGTLARTNNNDTSSATAISTVVGTSSTTNANDTLSASGNAGSVPDGAVNYTNINDTSSASGSTNILSSLARTNNNDTLAASGTGTPGTGVTTRLPLTGVGT